MPRRKKAKKKGPPDPRARDDFYMVEVVSFHVSGSASEWSPDEIPDWQLDDFIQTPKRPLLKEDLDLHLDLRPADPQFPEVTDCFATLHGSQRTPGADWDHFGGMIQKRKERLQVWFHSSLSLVTGLMAALLAGRAIWIRFRGSKLYRGRAGVPPVWWTLT